MRLNCLCIEGGGRDLATAVSYAKHSSSPDSSIQITNQSNSSTKLPTFDVSSNQATVTSNQAQPVLKHLIPAESILKPFLPKVNTASTRVHPPSTTTNITAASNAALSYSNAGGYGTGMKSQTSIPQGKYQTIILYYRTVVCVDKNIPYSHRNILTKML